MFFWLNIDSCYNFIKYIIHYMYVILLPFCILHKTMFLNQQIRIPSTLIKLYTVRKNILLSSRWQCVPKISCTACINTSSHLQPHLINISTDNTEKPKRELFSTPPYFCLNCIITLRKCFWACSKY